MNNKKGLSAIVATVLIILLVIAAVTLVWGPVRNMINKQSEGVEANCLMANPSITGTCLSGAKVSITIENGAEVDIGGFQVIYGDGRDNMAGSIVNDTDANKNSIITLVITNTSEAAFIRIAPIVEDQTCGAGEIKEVTTTAC